MNCVEAMRRGCPSTVSEKSADVRSDTGRPLLSRTLTSTGTRSTVDLNVVRGGCCGGCCSCAEAPAARSRTVAQAASPFMALSLLRNTRGHPVPQPSANRIAPARHFHFQAMRRAVTGMLRRGVGQQILMPQVVEDLLEDGLELVILVRKERGAATLMRQPAHQLLQRRGLQRPALPDHVDGGVGRLRARDHRRHRGVAGLIEIGRASCRERVEMSGGGGSLKKKKVRTCGRE